MVNILYLMPESLIGYKRSCVTIVNNIVGVSIEILCNFERRSFVSYIQELNVELEVGNKNAFIRNTELYFLDTSIV